MSHEEEPKNFEPKKPVEIKPPKDDPIDLEYLSKCNGMCSSIPELLHSYLELALYCSVQAIANEQLLVNPRYFFPTDQANSF
jgi:hypothetical protein